MIYLDGVNFNPETSDLDLVILLDDSYLSDIKLRFECFKELKTAKKELEKELLILWGKPSTREQIVSLLPVFAIEIQLDIHKSGVQDFYKNEFADIKKVMHETLSTTVKSNVNYGVPPLARQILQEVQLMRNAFLKNSATMEHEELAYSGSEPLPKKLSRSFAKLNSLQNELPYKGDEFNTSLGSDLLKSVLNTKRADEQFLNLYNWIDTRTGGRSTTKDSTNLEDYNHLLAYELLWGLTIQLKKKESEILSISEEFKFFLESVDILSKAHPREQELDIFDIYVEPTFKSQNSKLKKNIDLPFSNVIDSLINEELVIVTGESQSGKTTICKQIFMELFKLGFIPIYLSDDKNRYSGNLLNRINKSLSFQYGLDGASVETLSPAKVVIILDNFHLASKTKKVLTNAKVFPKILLTGDDIFGIGLTRTNLIAEYTHYRINEFTPSRRTQLIENWVRIGADHYSTENEILRDIDEKCQLVNRALGRLIGKGIMPSFPFYIYSFISNYEVGNKPLDQNISSYGYFYQSLIYTYLRKAGVKNEVISMYINYLTELSFYLYKISNKVLEADKYETFIKEYRENYTLTDSNKVVHKKLIEAGILSISDTGGFSFKYPYIYYFFCGKYLAENISSNADQVEYIMSNLHVDDFSYIAIFISHHEKNTNVLQDLALNAMYLFDKYEPATLSKTELEFFDNKIEDVIEATLPITTTSIQEARKEILENQDHREYKSIDTSDFEELDNKDEIDEEKNASELLKELRRSIRTVEVIGQILKNRVGSLKNNEIEELFEEGLKVHLRIIASYFDLIKDEEAQQGIVEMLAYRMSDMIQEENDKKQDKILEDKEAYLKFARKIFWNMNFGVVYSLITKIVSSLGSNLLITSINKVCDRMNTPSSFIIKQAINMWHNKKLNIDSISEKYKEEDFSKTAKQILNYKVVNHCRTHHIQHSTYNKLENNLGIKRETVTKQGRIASR